LGIVFALSSISLGLFAFYKTVQHRCEPPTCDIAQLSDSGVARLGQFGISTTLYETLILTQATGIVVVTGIVAAILVWRRPTDGFVKWVALVMILNTGTFTNAYRQLALAHPAWRLFAAFMEAFSWTSLYSLLFLFPTGRFVPSGLKWWPFASMVIAIVWLLSPDSIHQPLFQVSLTTSWRAWWLLVVSLFAFGAAVQIYRYRRIASLVERQQTKWVAAFGLTSSAAVALLFGLYTSLSFIVPSQSEFLFTILAIVAVPLPYLFPVFLTISILRYRLFDIDLLIRRTVLWAIISGVGLGVYLLAVGAASLFLGSQPDYLIPLVALILVAFIARPLYRRLERIMDRLIPFSAPVTNSDAE
jgi:hypothetical protein